MSTKQGIGKCAKIEEGKIGSETKVTADSIIESQSIEDDGNSSGFVHGNDSEDRSDGFEVVWC
jgi:hypothetical protein